MRSTSSIRSTTAKSARGQAGVADHDLGQPLVQRQGQHQGIGKRVGNLVEVEDGRHLGLAGQAVQPLGDVEHQVPAVAGGQPLDQLPPVADAVGLVAQACRGPPRWPSMVSGLVEFGRFLFAVAFGQVVGPQVVGQADVHGRLRLRLIGRRSRRVNG